MHAGVAVAAVVVAYGIPMVIMHGGDNWKRSPILGTVA
jgi:hypothetical protein